MVFAVVILVVVVFVLMLIAIAVLVMMFASVMIMPADGSAGGTGWKCNGQRGVDNDNKLWQWRQDVIDGKIDTARRDGTITVLDWLGETVVTYSFVRGWPCRYSAPGLSATSNEVLIEEIETEQFTARYGAKAVTV